MRRASRSDENQTAVVAALRKAGAKVQHLHGVGGGCPDLLVWHGTTLTLIEVKDGSKPPSARKLTPAQEKWHDEFQGAAHVVTSPEEAVNLILGRSQGVI